MAYSAHRYLDKFLDHPSHEFGRRPPVDDPRAHRVNIHIACRLRPLVSRSIFSAVERAISNSERPHSTDVRLLILQSTQPLPEKRKREYTSLVGTFLQPNLAFSKLKRFEPSGLAYLGIFICTDGHREPPATFSASITAPRLDLRQGTNLGSYNCRRPHGSCVRKCLSFSRTIENITVRFLSIVTLPSWCEYGLRGKLFVEEDCLRLYRSAF